MTINSYDGLPRLQSILLYSSGCGKSDGRKTFAYCNAGCLEFIKWPKNGRKKNSWLFILLTWVLAQFYFNFKM